MKNASCAAEFSALPGDRPKAEYAPKRIFREIRFGALCLPFQEELVKIEEK